jgi:prolipoprotein diacylglyceryl transferase
MMTLSSLAYIFWDPNPDAFTLPFTDRAVKWYGIFFALGFALCYILLVRLLEQRLKPVPGYTLRQLSRTLVDRIAWYVFLGTLIGARLGNALFYDWPYFKEHPLDILKFWEPGLASHGGFAGILIALVIFYYRNKRLLSNISFLGLLDVFVVPVPLACMCIRIGNFFNQEILGKPTDVPWAVIFAHPVDGGLVVPRHPVQLYEAIAYLLIFVLLWTAWHHSRLKETPGKILGMALVLGFTARFMMEFFKVSQTGMIDETTVSMGQYLSIPFILIGLCLIFRPKNALQSSNL